MFTIGTFLPIFIVFVLISATFVFASWYIASSDDITAAPNAVRGLRQLVRVSAMNSLGPYQFTEDLLSFAGGALALYGMADTIPIGELSYMYTNDYINKKMERYERARCIGFTPDAVAAGRAFDAIVYETSRATGNVGASAEELFELKRNGLLV